VRPITIETFHEDIQHIQELADTSLFTIFVHVIHGDGYDHSTLLQHQNIDKIQYSSDFHTGSITLLTSNGEHNTYVIGFPESNIVFLPHGFCIEQYTPGDIVLHWSFLRERNK